jgi:hypothetical protein
MAAGDLAEQSGVAKHRCRGDQVVMDLGTPNFHPIKPVPQVWVRCSLIRSIVGSSLLFGIGTSLGGPRYREVFVLDALLRIGITGGELLCG